MIASSMSKPATKTAILPSYFDDDGKILNMTPRLSL